MTTQDASKSLLKNFDHSGQVRCAIYRGGTSRAVVFPAADVPIDPAKRDAFLLFAMGSPHFRQIDGLGGAHPVTSKVAIVGPSTRPDCDVDYTFAQVDVTRPMVDYSGVCGNISSAIGPFAIDSGLVRVEGNSAQVRIYNTNTDRILIAHVPVRDGRVEYDGDYAIDGVPGSGSKIFLDYSRSTGTLSGKLLPTGRPLERIRLSSGGEIELTFCDLAYPCVFVDAAALGLRGTELPTEIEQNADVIDRQREIRGRAAQLLGLVGDWTEADEASPIKPLLVCVAPPSDAEILGGRLAASAIDLHARAFALNRAHETMAASGALCLAAASRVPGSVVQRILRNGDRSAPELRIGHPGGAMAIEIEVAPLKSEDLISVQRIGTGRTARPILEGHLFIPPRFR
jgi:hypothetical protein